MPGTAHDDDMPGRMVGDAGAVRDAFEQLPVLVAVLDGPDHRLAAMNAAFRAFTGRSDVLGVPYQRRLPRASRPSRCATCSTGCTRPDSRRPGRNGGRGSTARPSRLPGGLEEVYADFTVAPRRAADGTVNGLLVIATDVTDRVPERRAAARRRTRTRDGGPGIVAELQEALLPTALPVLPRARIAARYLVAGQEQSAGGDWFDAIPLADGSVALVVGDVVGHGVAAAAAMGQLRAVLTELLAAEADLGRVLERADAFAARTPALRAATLALAVLDPAGGDAALHHLRASSAAGHRHRRGGQVPRGHRHRTAGHRLAAGPGDQRARPGRAGPAVQRRPRRAAGPDHRRGHGRARRGRRRGGRRTGALAPAADPAAAERVCQRTVELLTRTGRADDITTLAAQRLADPVPALRLELPSERASLTTARDAFAGWLSRLGAAADDADALHLALVEVFTNAIEHAYPRGEPGIIELEATLGDDGNVECRVTDHGSWRPPDPADADRGHGLMVAGQVVDQLLVSHPPRPADGTAGGPAGTIVTLRHRLGRPAILASGHDSAHAAHPAEPPFAVDTSIAESATARALVRGPVDITTADQLARRLLSVSRGGTVPLVADLTGVTQLASAGVRALYAVSGQMAAHGQDLTLITAPGSAAHLVLDLVRLAHIAGDEP